MRKGINGRSKGASFERRVAKEISAWCGFPVSRTPQSGGWAKTGDITPKNPEDMASFIFSFELKNNESWHFSMVFQEPKLSGCFLKWWKQCIHDVNLSKKKRIPIVIFTRNRRPVFCLLQSSVFRKLGLHETVLVYTKIGGFRICLWQEILNLDYQVVLTKLGKA